jgi:multidrug efflux pump subunit AcrB
VIMFGLGFATILTLLFLPVLYCSVFKIKTIQE